MNTPWLMILIGIQFAIGVETIVIYMGFDKLVTAIEEKTCGIE